MHKAGGELPVYGVLGSSGASLVLWSTYSFVIEEYAALVTWPSECHVKAQDRYLHLLLDLGQLPEDRKDLPFGA
jgi:hypothetical protein